MKHAETFRKAFYQLSRNYISLIGLFGIIIITILAVFAPYLTPYPHHAGNFIDFAEANSPPRFKHPFGTDYMGRDVLSRTIFGFRYSLFLGGVVLGIVVPIGVSMGLLGGYFHDRLAGTIIMRLTDVFLAVPPLLLALSVAAILTPNLSNAMLAISFSWWPWYCRLVYSMVCSIRNEDFVLAAQVLNIPSLRITFGEILPNCFSAIITKMSLDMGTVILLGASLSFLGLGVQAPKPGLGTMVAEGAQYIPNYWWQAVFPSIAIVWVVLSFSFLGDGLRDALAVEQV